MVARTRSDVSGGMSGPSGAGSGASRARSEGSGTASEGSGSEPGGSWAGSEGSRAESEGSDAASDGSDAGSEGSDAEAEGSDAASEGSDAESEGSDARSEGSDAASECSEALSDCLHNCRARGLMGAASGAIRGYRWGVVRRLACALCVAVLDNSWLGRFPHRMARNPNWTRDEVILALDLYMRGGRQQLDSSHPKVLELSRLLNTLPIHPPELREAEFRNAAGVSMKLGNFLAVDPAYEGVGLSRGSRLEKEIWDEFASEPYRLRDLAEAIRSNRKAAEPPEPYRTPEDEEFPEGRILTRVHKQRERNRSAVRRKKERVMSETGRLRCEACDFDFQAIYGSLGNGFAECHHTVPVADLKEGQSTRLSDLAIVCANCHRMLHRSRPLMSVAELRDLLRRHKESA